MRELASTSTDEEYTALWSQVYNMLLCVLHTPGDKDNRLILADALETLCQIRLDRAKMETVLTPFQEQEIARWQSSITSINALRSNSGWWEKRSAKVMVPAGKSVLDLPQLTTNLIKSIQSTLWWFPTGKGYTRLQGVNVSLVSIDVKCGEGGNGEPTSEKSLQYKCTCPLYSIHAYISRSKTRWLWCCYNCYRNGLLVKYLRRRK